MKPLGKQSKTSTGESELVGELLSTIFPILRAFRREMRRQRPDLSEPQFRTMGFLYYRKGASLSDVASHLGLTLPTMSKMVDGLVKRELVAREGDPNDRRRVILRMTDPGKSAFETAKRQTNARLAEMLKTLTPDEQAAIVSALRIIRPVFLVNKEIE